MIEVKSKTDLSTRCEIKTFSYNGTFMGERSITCTYKSPEIIPFAIGDYIEYRGEKFVLDYDPSDAKEAEVKRSGDAITYNLTFHPESIVELENCEFSDYVLYDNQLHYSSSPKFSFIGTAHDLADRIKANLDRLYSNKWTIQIDPSVTTEDKNIEIENVSCWNAVVLFNKEFGLNFTVINHVIKIGFSSKVVDHTFSYGYNNGLYKIDRIANSDEAVITRLKAYGSDRNIPSDYNKLSTDIVPKKNLMLPGYKETGIDYIESNNISLYGIREYSVIFDDIYPSIEGVEVEGIGRIDEIVFAEQVTADTENKGTFKIKIKDIGFDINDYLVSGETATISIKNGYLIGYEFEITKVEKLDTGGYELTLNKSKRDDWTVPNKDQNLSSGDRFVLLNIRMPEKYVSYAEERLLERAKQYLSRYDHVNFTYDIGVDEIFMARNVSLYESIREGDKLPLYDADLSVDNEIIIQSLVITEGDNVPTYKITLSDQPIAGTIDKIWDAISNIKNQGTIYSQIGGGISKEELNRKYLRKDVPDTAFKAITFEDKIGSSIFLDDYDGKGWEIKNNGHFWLGSANIRDSLYVGDKIGSPSFAPGFPGWGVEIDIPTATITADNLFARKNFTAYTITYSQIYGLGGNQIVSDINKIARVEVLSDRYRCYMDSLDGLMLMNMRIGDGARIQSRTSVTSVKYLIGRVINISSDYFDIDIDLLEGTGIPASGDYVLRWGNDRDTTRQGLIYLTSADQGSPFVAVYDGITGTSTKDKLKVQFGNISNIRTKRGVQLKGYGAYLEGAFIENSSVILNNGMTVEQQFIVMNGEFNSTIEGLKNDISLEAGNILRNSSFSRDKTYWESLNDVHFINSGNGFLWLDGSFYVEKNAIADIYRDGNKNVLRILNTSIKQRNENFTNEAKEGTYSFSFFCKILRAGTLSIGFTGQELFLTRQLDVSDSYIKVSKTAAWNGDGDFSISFTGEILIYSVSLFNDALADAVINLQTQITQNAEAIKLAATKEYVDGETGKIYTYYNSQFQITAGEISAISTKVDTINDTIDTAGWITEAQGNNFYAAKEMENGATIISTINQTAEEVAIEASKIRLEGIVTANNKFKVLLDGSIEATDGRFSGTINADSGFIGGFEIKDGQIVSSILLQRVEMILNPSGGLYFNESNSKFARMGPATVSMTSGLTGLLSICDAETDNGSTSKTLANLFVGRSVSSDVPQVWMDCKHFNNTGWGSAFKVESRYLDNANAQERTCINVGALMDFNQIKKISGQEPELYPLYWDNKSQYVCYKY